MTGLDITVQVIAILLMVAIIAWLIIDIIGRIG